jgi:uncharacterized UBP type Zn finger protein
VQSAKSDQPSSVVASSESEPSAIPSKANKKSLYSGALPLTFPDTVRTLGAGLDNHGNTCYLNSVTQAVIHTPGLAHLLNAHKADVCELRKKGKFCTMCSIRMVQLYSFNKQLTSAQGSYYPSALTKNLKCMSAFHAPLSPPDIY